MVGTCRMTPSADGDHCQEIGPQYGTTFEFVLYDSNNSLVIVFFSHSVGTECDENWTTVFICLKDVKGFDSEGHVTITDQQKSIDKAYRTFMDNTITF